MKLVRVVSSYFVAGFETDGTIRRAAPILAYMVGWSDQKAKRYMRAKGWNFAVVEPLDIKSAMD